MQPTEVDVPQLPQPELLETSALREQSGQDEARRLEPERPRTLVRNFPPDPQHPYLVPSPVALRRKRRRALCRLQRDVPQELALGDCAKGWADEGEGEED